MKFLLACCVLMKLMETAQCCMCMPKHPQAAFCSAGFAFKGMVISDRVSKPAANSKIFEQLGIPAPVYSYYEVLVFKVYKGDVKSKEDTFSNFFKVTIQTNQHESLCGRAFTRGKSYIFTGRMFNKELQVNQCDWVEEYSHVTPQMRRGLKGQFDCKCKVNTCLNGYCDNKSECKWQISFDEPMDECTQKHRICRHDNNGECAWASSMFYDSCTNKIPLDILTNYKQK